MNFRSCKYFLTVCEMGSISAAARKLYISQQSLSSHIRRLEEETGTRLFHRDHPLTLTPAGECVQRAAKTILETLEQMDRELAECRGGFARELTIGTLDYGTPDFMSDLIDLFLRKEPSVLLNTREVSSKVPIPADIPLLITGQEMGNGFKSEAVIFDWVCVSVADSLLQRTYGDQWEERRGRLEQGDLLALEGCPFLLHRGDNSMQRFQDMVLELAHFTPVALSVSGSAAALTQLCDRGRGALIGLMQQALRNQETPCYPISALPGPQATGFLCYREDTVLSEPAQRFLEITRRYFDRRKRTLMQNAHLSTSI